MNWQRTLVGVLLGVLFVAMMLWTTFAQTGSECEVCVNFEGRSGCSTANAATRDPAPGASDATAFDSGCTADTASGDATNC